MYKVIDLGSHVQETGEARVQVIDPSMVKTASTEIQSFWDSLSPSPEFAYLWVIGVSAVEFYGCNNNGDAFYEEDLRKTHKDFVSNAHIFLHHVNKDPAKSIGKPVYSWYNDEMHRIELILAVNKNARGAEDIVLKIQNGEQLYVSMGCRVAHDVCSICGNKAPTRAQYCEHLRYNMKKILPDGRQVFAYNPDPKFFDISLVRKPADPTAFALDKMASEGEEYIPAILSAELGEQADSFQEKMAAVSKVADIIKQVEGTVADAKAEPYAEKVRTLMSRGFDEMDYPTMPYESLEHFGMSPAGLFAVLSHLGAPMTIGDAAWMAGRHCLGRCPSREEMCTMFRELPMALESLHKNPDSLFDIAQHVLSGYGGEFEKPLSRQLIIKIVRPVAQARITIMQGFDDPDMEKSASVFGRPDNTRRHYGANSVEKVVNSFTPRSENFASVEFTDKHGRTVRTTPYHLRQGAIHGGIDKALKKGAGMTLALGALAALLASGNADLYSRVGTAALMGIPAAHLLSGKNDRVQISHTGDEVAVGTLNDAVYKQEKHAALDFHPKEVGKYVSRAPLLGMAIPAALALDYAYNRWKYGDYADPHLTMLGSAANSAGKFVHENPVLSSLAGATLGAMLKKKI